MSGKILTLPEILLETSHQCFLCNSMFIAHVAAKYHGICNLDQGSMHLILNVAQVTAKTHEEA